MSQTSKRAPASQEHEVEERIRDDEDRGDEAKDVVQEDDAIDCKTQHLYCSQRKTLHCFVDTFHSIESVQYM